MRSKLFHFTLSLLFIGSISCNSGDDLIEVVVQEGSPGSVVYTDWDPNKAQQSKKRKKPAKTGKAIKKNSKTKPKKVQSARKDSFQLQLGAFVNEDNANGLIKTLEKKGYQPYIEDSHFKGKKWFFVKIGSYRQKKSAVATAKKLSPFLKTDIIILKNKTLLERVKAPIRPEKNARSTITELKKQQKEKTKRRGDDVASDLILDKPVPIKQPKVFKSKANPKANKSASPYSFQIGGLYTLENAKKQLKVFQAKGYSPYLEIVKEEITNEKWYSVRIGRFKSIRDAVDEARFFSAKEELPTRAQPLDY